MAQGLAARLYQDGCRGFEASGCGDLFYLFTRIIFMFLDADRFKLRCCLRESLTSVNIIGAPNIRCMRMEDRVTGLIFLH